MRIGEYELETPVINGGGVVKTVQHVEMMAKTAVGAILAGSYTLEPRAGNDPNGETVYHHDPVTGITTNSLGLPNQGLEAVAQDLPTMIQIAHDHDKPFILNFAPMGHDPVLEIWRMSEILNRAGVTGLDAIELNASCPNVVMSDGNREPILSKNPVQLEETLLELSDIQSKDLPFGDLLVRISPFSNRSEVEPLVTAVGNVGLKAVTAFNTFPNGKPLDAAGNPILQVPNGTGGQSGWGMATIAEQQLDWLVSEAEDQKTIDGELPFEVIASNGVHDGQTMVNRLNLGAEAVSCSTIFWETRRWGDAVNKLLSEYVEVSEQ